MEPVAEPYSSSPGIKCLAMFKVVFSPKGDARKAPPSNKQTMKKETMMSNFFHSNGSIEN